MRLTQRAGAHATQSSSQTKHLRCSKFDVRRSILIFPRATLDATTVTATHSQGTTHSRREPIDKPPDSVEAPAGFKKNLGILMDSCLAIVPLGMIVCVLFLAALFAVLSGCGMIWSEPGVGALLILLVTPIIGSAVYVGSKILQVLLRCMSLDPSCPASRKQRRSRVTWLIVLVSGNTILGLLLVAMRNPIPPIFVTWFLGGPSVTAIRHLLLIYLARCREESAGIDLEVQDANSPPAP